MDAVGPDGAWSPRGNRAVDIQALWYAQLRAAANIARTIGDGRRADGWNRYADRVRKSVLQFFVDRENGGIYDHLDDDGTPDLKLRPNMLFPLTIPGADIFAALPDSLIDVALRRLFSEAVYPWGVASLSQEDPDFHPWHEAPRHYPKDAAYHNGTIWTWLTGPAVTTLTRRGLADSAWVLTRTLERLARDSWAVGTIPECTDALPRDGARYPRPSGTFSQAWSNAEYLRNWYQDYLGVTPTWTGDGKPVVRLSPALPSALLQQPGDSVAANVRVGKNWIRVAYYFDGASRGLRLDHLSGRDAVRIETGAPEAIVLEPGISTRSAYPQSAVLATAMPDSLPLFASPRQTENINVIQPPAWPRIDGASATRVNEAAKELCSAFDPENDDTGPDGKQRYPVNSIFKKGIADILWFQVSADADRLYFTIRMQALTQPGWHPEYGFQLSILAIAIDQSHEPGKQSREVGYASGYVLAQDKGYDRLILVGGGVRVTDAAGAILCEFIPETVSDAFGTPASATIRFSLPRSCLGGGFDHWRYTVVSGLQDDHGGAGVGEFRTVHPQPSEWHGGGSTHGVNWYDVLHCPAE
jgi:hypothetical protein